MKALPPCVVQVLDKLPDALPQKIVLNTDGKGHWEIEVFSRYAVSEDTHTRPAAPPREKAIRHLRH
jgi:hypothetical protein